MSLFAKQALLLVVAAVVAVLSATSAGASVTVVNRLLTSESFQESSAHFRRLEPAFNFSLTHGVKHTRRRGLSEQIHQPYPDDLTVQFSSHGKVFKLTLSIAHHQVSDDARVVVETDDGQVILPHSLTSYTSTHLADHLNDVRAASVTILHHTAGADGGNVHGVFVDNDGVMYQIDPVEEHADYMEPEAYERLRRNAPHGLVVHRKLDTIGERAANAHCGNVDLPRGLRATRSKGRHLATADSADNGDPTRWTNCFNNDNVARKLEVGFGADKGFYDTYGGTPAKVQEKIQAIVADTNTVYQYQFNIFISIAEWYIMSTSSGPAWNDAGGSSCMTINSKLDKTRTWSSGLSDSSTPRNRGLWHVMSSCYGCGTVGLAYVGVICETRSGYNTGVSGQGRCADWVTVAHEIGHNFGGDHSFEEGQGSTGGIMDYGDGKLSGIYQFNTKYRKTQMCNEVNNNINCAHFKSYAPECGNGVVEAGEACECESGGTNCACCQNCQLKSGAQCSSGECCNTATCKYHDTTKTCGGGTKHCNLGTCTEPQCTKYGYTLCGFFSNGCKSKCARNGGECSEMNGLIDGSTRKPINEIFGSCNGGAGTCNGGVCESTGGAPTDPPTDPPTRNPTRFPTNQPTDFPTNQPTKRPTNQPTEFPTKQPTKRPTNPPINSATKYPTEPPTRDPTRVPTRFPTSQPTDPPTRDPTRVPTRFPTNEPTDPPTRNPTKYPTRAPTDPITYGWVTGSFGGCSVTCGSDGYQQRAVQCKDSKLTVVSDAFCSGSKPSTTQPCDPVPPPCITYAWADAQYSSCSKSCGTGKRTRVGSACQATTSEGIKVMVDNQLCVANAKNAEPPTTINCNTQACDLKYYAGDWSSCSKSCGGGKENRVVRCTIESDDGGAPAGQANSRVVAESLCVSAGVSKPSTSRNCNTQACTEYEWLAGSFGACDTGTDKNCGSGVRRRTITCMETISNSRVSDSNCDSGRKPAAQQACFLGDCPKTTDYGWVPGAWQGCPVSCGESVEYRDVKCREGAKAGKTNGAIVIEELCTLSKPITSRECVGSQGACPIYEFKTGSWSTCSRSCGSGTIRRDVTCVDANTGGNVADSKCTQSGLKKPSTSQECNITPCSKRCLDSSRQDCGSYWSVGQWSSCSRQSGFGEQSRQVRCRRISNDRVLSDSYCGGSKPQTKTDCNAFPAPTFVPGEWGECDAACDDGLKQRDIFCVDHLGNKVDESECSGTRPISQSPCNERPCPHWHKNLWGDCTSTCGGGVRRRTADCRLPHDGVYLGKKVVPSLIADLCPTVKPVLEETCNIEPCGPFAYRTSEWSECSRGCEPGEKDLGLAIHTRDVWCVDTTTNTRTLESECIAAGLVRPPTEKSCADKKCPTYRWGIVDQSSDNEWSECDKQCGSKGIQRRVVQCRDLTGDVVFGYSIPYEVVEESFCNAAEKPADTRSCGTSDCGGTTNGRCSSSGFCECAPGFGKSDCTVVPAITDVQIEVNQYPEGVPPGNVVEVTWTSVGGAKKIDVLLNVPGQDAPIVLTTAKRYPNENKILVTMPTEIAGGDGFTISVYHATGLSGTSDPFKVSDACAYVSCGTNGQCVDGKCECLNFYSGDSCRISPCAAAGCLSFAPGVDTCDVDVNGTVTCGCNEGFVGEKCQHPQGCENHCQNGGIANPGLIETTVNGAQNINCGTCTCPQGTAFTGDKCQTCPLECQGGKPNDSCTGCVCEKGWAGSQCQCGQFIITMQMKANENMRATDSILKTIIEHDIMKAIFEDVPDFDGSVQDVAYKSCGGDCIEVTFNLREKCLATPLGRRLSWALPRRLSSDAVKSAYDAVYAQSKDKWSVLRAHGIVTSTFDASFGIKAEDPTGRHDLETDNGLGMAALIGIIVGCVALFSVLGFFLVKNDMIGNPFNSISESLERRRKKRQSLKLNDTSHSQIEIKHMDKRGGTQTYNRPGFTSAMGTSYSNKSGFPAMPQQMTMPPGVSSKQMVSNPMSTSSRTAYKKQTSQLSAYQPKPTKPTFRAPPAKKKLPPLPAGWIEVVDEDSGDTYYWNEHTDETSWDRPLPPRPGRGVGVQRL